VGEPLLAVRWLDRALDEGEPTPRLLALLADAALQGGDIARARAAVDEGLHLAPGDRALLSLRRRVASDPARP